MKQRTIYYRRKDGKIIAEGKRNKKTIFLFTIPDVETLLKSSLFTQEKIAKIHEKINRLDYRPEKVKKAASKVLPINIIRTPKKDEVSQEDRDKLNDILMND